jgi:SnoaL-like domain
MITKEQALDFAHEWVAAWNAHDLERVLSHYTEDFEMSSPFIVSFTGEPSGTLKGRAQVGAYWRTALERIPNLRFELLEVFTCVNSITIYYKAVLGKSATEIFFINQEGKVYKALAHYNQ